MVDRILAPILVSEIVTQTDRRSKNSDPNQGMVHREGGLTPELWYEAGKEPKDVLGLSQPKEIVKVAKESIKKMLPSRRILRSEQQNNLFL